MTEAELAEAIIEAAYEALETEFDTGCVYLDAVKLRKAANRIAKAALTDKGEA